MNMDARTACYVIAAASAGLYHTYPSTAHHRGRQAPHYDTVARALHRGNGRVQARWETHYRYRNRHRRRLAPTRQDYLPPTT